MLYKMNREREREEINKTNNHKLISSIYINMTYFRPI